MSTENQRKDSSDFLTYFGMISVGQSIDSMLEKKFIKKEPVDFFA